MSICPGTGGKARNSGLLAKGAADWSAAGARLKDFLFKKGSESGPPSDTPTLGRGVPISALASKSEFKNSLRLFFGHLLKTQLFIMFW